MDTAYAVLTIDLDAVRANWRQCNSLMKNGKAAAVVKADAYGLGMEKVAPALAAAGAETFFVATIDEGIRLRGLLPSHEIQILGGLLPGTEPVFLEHRLTPMLNSLGDLERWQTFCHSKRTPLAASLHVDTGMLRLGLPPDELGRLVAEPERLTGVTLSALISHLACADEAGHPLTDQQQRDFCEAYRLLRPALGSSVRLSLANSSGLHRGAEFHFDLARPGCALYGVNPTPEATNPMAQPVVLQGKILQIRHVDTPRTVGYGASHQAQKGQIIATVGVGYADGYLRYLSNRGTVFVGGQPAPVVGRVSMDLITIDVTGVEEINAHPGALVDLIGPDNPVDAVAEAARTIGYEILTSLGPRYRRVYTQETEASERIL
ncbi:MAG: alanine racemase [Magnetovibrionaceae bacterium]